MGFRLWYEGLKIVLSFSFVVGLPCILVTLIGMKMINDLGNSPSKSASIQTGTIWKLFIIEIVTGFMFWIFFRIFS